MNSRNQFVTAVLAESTAIEAIESVVAGKEKRIKFWVSAYFVCGDSNDAQSAHATVEAVKEDGLIKLNSIDADSLSLTFEAGSNTLELTWPKVGVAERRQIIFATNRMSTTLNDDDESYPAELTCLDISPQGGLYAYGTVRGEVIVGSTQDGQILRRMKTDATTGRVAHLLDTLQVKFFPASNGEVILSSSRDMQIQLWSTVDGSNPRTFQIKGQPLSQAPASISMIPPTGRNFLTAAGPYVSLWECGSGQLVHVFELESLAASVLQVLTVPYTTALTSETVMETEESLEFGTSDKAVLAVQSDGIVATWDAFTKELIHTTGKLLSPGIEITYAVLVNNDTLLASTNQGHLIAWNLTSLFTSSPIEVFPLTRILPWSISAIASVTSNVVVLCTSSSPVLVSLFDLRIISYFTGFDSVAATALATHNSKVYIGGKAGILNVYSC